MKIEQSNQVGAVDITYIPMMHGFIYLSAVVGVFSRRDLSHRISITLEVGFCFEALQEAIERQEKSEISNKERSSQFISSYFIKVLQGREISISIDGKATCRDNVFVERLWRSVKYEEVFLQAYQSVSEAITSIGRY